MTWQPGLTGSLRQEVGCDSIPLLTMGVFTYQPDDYCLPYVLLKAAISRRIRLEKESVTKCKLDVYQPTSIG